MTTMNRLQKRVCSNCGQLCGPTQLYCPKCGFVLPDALTAEIKAEMADVDEHEHTQAQQAVNGADNADTPDSKKTTVAEVIPPTHKLASTGSQRVLAQPGTGYFHQHARLYLHHDSGRIIPVDVRTGTKILGRRGSAADGGTGDLRIVDLTDLGAVEYGVSRRHLQVTLSDDVIYAMDLGSTNGTFLNRERLTPDQPYVVRNRSVLQLGVLILRVQFA
ncbi:MAG: FHA domain-containing protein [Anaerolineae bacterium]|nr:FHA domain-containing protein [Anaerolineae bacterium]